METLQTLTKVPYFTTDDQKCIGQLRLAKILNLTYLVFAPEYSDDEDNFFIQTGDYNIDGMQFNAKATINYGENGNCFFSIPEKLISLTEGQ